MRCCLAAFGPTAAPIGASRIPKGEAELHAALLSKGLLPRELPPLFSSATLAGLVGQPGLPPDFSSAAAVWTQPLQHNLSRPGGLRRKLSIPNPVNYFRLARTFDANSAALSAHWSHSSYSQTKPDVACGGPRAIAGTPADRAATRTKARVGARYLLRTDIAQFYPSIYSHSIPWALYTKSTAKTIMRDMSYFGNVLDREVQAGQHGQTKGVPIGPDTSLGIAELLLAPIDSRLHTTCNVLGGTRFIDDIELTFRRLSDADTALATLESLLSDFELQLNPIKTKICELPDEIESDFVTNLRSYLPASGTNSRAQWVDYFNRAFVAARNKPKDGVLRYAVSALQSVQIGPNVWEIAQQLLWQCVTADPGCLRFVADVLLGNRITSGHIIDVSMGSTAINSLIESSAPIGHGSEVVWSLWVSMLLNLQIETRNQDLIAAMDDAIVAVAAMIAKEQAALPPSFDSTLWRSWLVTDAFKDEYWLFAYECTKRGWFAAEVTTAGLNTNANIAFLLSCAVSFVDLDALLFYTPSRMPISGGSGGGGGGY
ncbi:Reverse transcriptase (RNA-dependent DNA polymerase) [Roseateles sp. YR242]|uniref:RNA-directed DNA polymerase n=1 Tax=Roseateles sp. YR242 TaxID=1855305 RepID=UPI0008CFDC4C|nr:RNA-directed DNA polymerase [Roseateles sp. YR242]SEK54045.1 Reverse transcriptase (RNA-dependent DNA polymerase) [Roseateles sp. YR242]